jgi:hypothetical protein
LPTLSVFLYLDSTGGWFEGEIMFFDFYNIPLAKKLLDSKAFGVAGDEYLNYAVDNRAEWAAKGMTMVREMASQDHRDKFLGDLVQKTLYVPRIDLNKSRGMAA